MDTKFPELFSIAGKLNRETNKHLEMQLNWQALDWTIQPVSGNQLVFRIDPKIFKIYCVI